LPTLGFAGSIPSRRGRKLSFDDLFSLRKMRPVQIMGSSTQSPGRSQAYPPRVRERAEKGPEETEVHAGAADDDYRLKIKAAFLRPAS
jgi:hypothetical protein